MKVSDYIADFLAEHRVHHIFTISGSTNVHLLDSISRNKKLRYVCPHHEQAGMMATIAYSRLCDNQGLMLAHDASGSSNTMIGVIDAWADSIPVVIISGQEKTAFAKPENPLRMWGVQGFNIIKSVEHICKYAVTVADPKTIRYHLEKAFHICNTGRPGPVWVDIPVDVQTSQIEPATLNGFKPEPAEIFDVENDIQKIIQMLQKAKRPVIHLGHGIRLAGAVNLISKLLKKFPVPFLTAWNGADMIPTPHPQHFGHPGIYGHRCPNFVAQNCDLLWAIGTRLAIPQIGYEKNEYARGAKKIMVDIDQTELDKFKGNFDLLIRSDAKIFIEKLLQATEKINFPEPAEWMQTCQNWRKKYPMVDPSIHEQKPGFINSYYFINHLSNYFSDNEMIITDMGTALTSTHQAIVLQKNQRLVTSTGLGEMGFGLPGAVGACFARPGERVILIAGDGSFMMNIQEMQTVIHHRLPIKLFLYCNDAYLSIRHTQNALFGKDKYAATGAATGVSCPDFCKVASAFGWRAIELRDWNKVDEAIQFTLEGNAPALCQIIMDPLQPLVPKTSFNIKADGTLVSPPLEDLFPFLPRETLKKEMVIPIHPKSEEIKL